MVLFRTLLLAVVVGWWASGCAGTGRAGGAGGQVEPQDEPVDVVAGAPIVAPLTRSDFASLGGAGDVQVRLDGVPMSGRVVEFVVAAGADAAGWLPASGQWSTRPARRSRSLLGLRVGFAVLIVPDPPSGAVERLAVGGRVWQARRWEAPAPDPSWLEPAASPEDEAESLTLLAPAIRHPLRRWRVGLLADRIELGGDQEFAAALRRDRFADSDLEALARHSEALWRTGLSNLAADAPWVARDLATRLTRTVDFGAGIAAPAWPLEQESLQQLRDDLLNPALTGAQRTARARAWLDGEPEGVAWVKDDAGAADVLNEVSVPIVGFAALERGLVKAHLRTVGGRVGPARYPEPGEAVSLVIAAPFVPGERTLTVATGSGLHEVRTLSGPIEARPPGARLGPSFADWTLRSWLESTPPAAPAQRAMAALLQPRADGEGWEIYVECRTPEVDPASDEARRRQSEDSVTVWFGPAERPLAALRIDGLGAIEDLLWRERHGGRDAMQRYVPLTRSADRWSVHVPVPEEAIEGEGFVRVALMRVDADGARSTWPRPLAPWEETPGRALFDLRVWGGGVAAR